MCQHCFLSLKLTCYIDPWDPFLRKHSLWRWTTESVAIRKFFIIFYYPISSESMMTFMVKSSVNVSIYAKWPLAFAQRSFFDHLLFHKSYTYSGLHCTCENSFNLFFYDLESSLFSNGSRSWLKHGSGPSSFIPWALPQLYVLLTSHSVAMPMVDLGWESGRLDFWRLKLFVSWAGDGFGVGGWGRPWKQCCSQRRHLQTEKNGTFVHTCFKWLQGESNSRSKAEYN